MYEQAWDKERVPGTWLFQNLCFTRTDRLLLCQNPTGPGHMQRIPLYTPCVPLAYPLCTPANPLQPFVAHIALRCSSLLLMPCHVNVVLFFPTRLRERLLNRKVNGLDAEVVLDGE